MPIAYLCNGCHTTIPTPGRCPNCTINRGTTNERGYGSDWQRLAAQAKALHPYCAQCGTTDDLTVDHIDPTKRTGLTLADVQVL
jgi:hypothetical protein